MARPPQQPWRVPAGTVLPPPPPGMRHVCLPVLGIVIADDDLRRRVDRRFHYPMIVLALLVLPLLVLDYRFVHESHVDPNFQPTRDWTWWLTITGLTIIWVAFLVEFIVKIMVAEDRIEYLQRNWLDLVIIVIPVLRPLRAAAIARTTRVFTLRGVGFKFARYVFTLVVGLEATDRFLHRCGLKTNPRGLDPERMTRHQLMTEIRRLRRINAEWEQWRKAEEEYIRERGGTPYSQTHPNNAEGNSQGPPALESTPDANHLGATQSDGR